ncbi:hypothetical protein Bca52824_088171 [Brassica carinata]|uniref:Uncharacterized protein n=1 Tax=Brassica carinata TaxID=52824 RepID=A0A8X7PDN2_BRACI|nr:hypothetical protein Bca52824_088171 [Brassica carinata]
MAEHRYESFSSREFIQERSKGHLERTVTSLVGYIPEIVKEFYAALPGEITRASKDRMADALTIDELADFLTEGTLSLRNLTTRFLSPCKAALVILSAYKWVPSSTRLIYKMFQGIRVDVGEMLYAQILNLAVLKKEGGKKDTRWLILPRTIFGVLQTKFEMQRKPREKLSPIIPYKKNSRLGKIYLKNQKEEREAPKKAQRQAKKKRKSASTSTAAPRLDHLQALLDLRGLILLDMCH